MQSLHAPALYALDLTIHAGGERSLQAESRLSKILSTKYYRYMQTRRSVEKSPFQTCVAFARWRLQASESIIQLAAEHQSEKA
jgi:hypothetical protein